MEVRASAVFEVPGVDVQYHNAPSLYIPPASLELPLFTAAGYYWRVCFYPTNILRSIDHFSLTLELMSRGSRVKAAHELSVMDRTAILPPRVLSAMPPQYYFVHDCGGACGEDHSNDLSFSSAGVNMDRNSLHDKCVGYVHGGRLLFQCTVIVFPEDQDQTTPGSYPQIDVPPSDMIGQLGEVLETSQGADVTFSVEGELFPAHKIILAMRSPVFKAKFFGEMKANGAVQSILVDDMRADTFRALLRYIYTDASPAVISNTSNHDEGGGDDGEEDHNVWELLMAADRYGVERLKLICERVLCKRLDVDNVADSLALADQHHCDTLKDACIEFMTTSHRMGKVAATQGYMQLKNSHPYLLFEVLEKSSRFHKGSENN